MRTYPSRPAILSAGPLAAVLTLLAIWSCTPVPAATAAPDPGADAGAIQGDSGLLYVCNQDDATVSVVDLESHEVVRTVDLQALGFSENAKPHHIAVDPDGSHWYVSLIGEGVVAKLDREGELVATAPFDTPGMLALDPSNDNLFVARSMTAVNPPRRIGLIQRSDMSIEEVDIFFPRPHALVLHPELGIAYTASLGVNQIAAVDPETGRATLTDVEGPPHALMQFAISPDGSTLAVPGEISHTMHFFDVSEDPLEPRHLGAVDVGIQPFDPIFTADGSTVWFGNKAESTIMAIDVATQEIVATLDDERIREPHGAARSLDGEYVIISNANVREGHTQMLAEQGDGGGMDHGQHMEGMDPPERIVGGRGNVTIIDPESREIVAVVELGQNVSGIQVGPR